MLDAPLPDRVSTSLKRGAPVTEMPLRRDAPYRNDFVAADADLDGDFAHPRRNSAVRVSFRVSLFPKTLWGRIAAACALLLLAVAGIAALIVIRGFLLHDPHFTVESSRSIQIAGNSHLTRAQLLSVFGEDVDRNIFTIPLAARRAELESLPWVEHATVMRLLPDRVRVAIVERTPVAFVRQGAQIGLVDANGVLFDLPEPEGGDSLNTAIASHYSFPVLTGISREDPLSLRAARMKIYLDFVSALDASGENISHKLSEVDLSNPEDVKAIIPSTVSRNSPDAASAGAGTLVHFGDEKFLERYRQFQQHLAEWRSQYPKLASVDMRYERQVVLEMQPGASVATPAPAAAPPAAAEGAPNGPGAVTKKQPAPAAPGAPR